jgi:hypothetical protein
MLLNWLDVSDGCVFMISFAHRFKRFPMVDHKMSRLGVFPEIEHQAFTHKRVEKLIQKTG